MNTKNIKAVNEEIIEKTAGNETDNRLKILELLVVSVPQGKHCKILDTLLNL